MIFTISSLELAFTCPRLRCRGFRSLERCGPVEHLPQRAWAVWNLLSSQTACEAYLRSLLGYTGSQKGAALLPCRPDRESHRWCFLVFKPEHSPHSSEGSFHLSTWNSPINTGWLPCLPFFFLKRGDRLPSLPYPWQTAVEAFGTLRLK